MTTSYELSLRLKELGVEQNWGEYYWVYTPEGEELRHISDIDIIVYHDCRAFTLGELVRMIGDGFNIITRISDDKWTIGLSPVNFPYPEEAAGELWAELLTQEKLKA